eukprot:scaffold381_cov168-Ochromonas_danica.AAC.10
MIVAFDPRIEEFQGKPVLTGFAFHSSLNFPSIIKKPFDQDMTTASTDDFHRQLKTIVGSNQQAYFAVYSNDIHGEDYSVDDMDQHPVELTLSLRFTSQITFDKEELRQFLTLGTVKADPPVLTFTFAQGKWLGEGKWDNISNNSSSSARFTPKEGEVLVDREVPAMLAFSNDPVNYTPYFSDYRL